MGSYKDGNGVVRHVEIEVDGVERVLSRLGVNLYSLEDLGPLAADTMKFLKVVHCMTAHQEPWGEWWKAHKGDAADEAASAFIETLCDDFFPNRLANLIRERNQAVSRAVESAWKGLETEFAVTSGGSPDTSGSTPAP